MVVGHPQEGDQPLSRRKSDDTHSCAHVHIHVRDTRTANTSGRGRRGRSFSELGWPPSVQLANSRTQRVNCTTTYIPRRRRNAATMMPSHEITRDMPRHDIPLAGNPACPCERARGKREPPYTGWSLRESADHVIHSPVHASTADRTCRRSAAQTRADLLFLVNPDRSRTDGSPSRIAEESPVSRLNRSSLSFFHRGSIRLMLRHFADNVNERWIDISRH